MTSNVQQLIEDNLMVLGQGCDLLQAISCDQFTTSAPAISLSGVGPHIRHVIDFYERFLGAIERSANARLGTGQPVKIDYDARDRDPRIESEREHACRALRSVARRIQAAATSPMAQTDAPLSVRADGSPFVASCVSRELQSLVSHTVHHYALIAVSVRSAGGDPGHEFGVAPSTLRHWAENAVGSRG